MEQFVEPGVVAGYDGQVDLRRRRQRTRGPAEDVRAVPRQDFFDKHGSSVRPASNGRRYGCFAWILLGRYHAPENASIRSGYPLSRWSSHSNQRR